MLLKFVFAAALGLSGSAMAQEAIPTAVGAPTGGAPVPSASGPLRLPDHYNDGPDIIRTGSPCGAPPKADGTADKSPHGEVFAGVGTRGYREAGGVVCVPIGAAAAVTVAVDAGRIDGRGGRR